ncbi:hypothetical protein DFH06DRAFT_1339524 [Mycena polygramma]|nr:hypothetical protein DFH06DRAFT_1339524 [Mycena polygramma]
MSSALDVLPLEVNGRIFALLLYSARPFSYRELLELRYLLCCSSSAWNRVVRWMPLFWTHILMALDLTLAGALLCADLSRNSPLHVYLDLQLFSRYRQDPARDAEIANNFLEAILTVISRVVELTVITDNSDAILVLRQGLRAVHAPRLRRLSLSFHPRPPSSHTISRTLDSMPYAWFGHGIVDVEVLHLHQQVLCFHLFPTHALRSLRLFDIAPFAMDFGLFAAVIGSSPNLEELVLAQVGCFYSTDDIILSTSVKRFHVEFRRDGSSTRLISAFRFPHLELLRLHVATSFEVGDAEACAPHFGSITELAIQNSGGDAPSAVALHRFFPRVRTLDLRAARNRFFERLTVISGLCVQDGLTTVFPALVHLQLAAGEMFSDVQMFVAFHGLPQDQGARPAVLRSVSVYGSTSEFLSFPKFPSAPLRPPYLSLIPDRYEYYLSPEDMYQSRYGNV